VDGQVSEHSVTVFLYLLRPVDRTSISSLVNSLVEMRKRLCVSGSFRSNPSSCGRQCGHASQTRFWDVLLVAGDTARISPFHCFGSNDRSPSAAGSVHHIYACGPVIALWFFCVLRCVT